MRKVCVLVADGAKARVLMKDGKALIQVGPLYDSRKMLGENDKGQEKPGRTRRNAPMVVYEPHTPWDEQQKCAFAREMAKIVNTQGSNFDTLIMIAPPHALGELRKHLDPHILDKLEHEVAKDLVNAPLNEIIGYTSKPYT